MARKNGKRIKNYDLSIFDDPNNLAMGQRYVYFSSLLSEPKNSPLYQLGIKAQRYLTDVSNGLLSQGNDGKNNGKITTALSFLQQAALFERTKEVSFFQNYKSQYSDVFTTFQFNPSDSNFNYEQFIIDINTAMKGLKSFKSELDEELDRIKRMRAADDIIKANSKNFKGMSEEEKNQYIKDITANAMTAGGTKEWAKDDSAFYLKRAGEITMRGLTSNGNLSSEITDTIINTYGEKLFLKSGDHLKLNGSMVSIMLKILEDKLYAEMINQYGTVKNSENRKKQLQTIALSKEMQEYTDNLLNNESLLQALASIAEQHGITDVTLEQAKVTQKEIDTVTDKLRSWYNSIRTKKMPSFETWLQENEKDLNIKEMIQAVNAAKSQAYYTGEDLSLTTLIAAGFKGILGGSANPTDDIEAGKLICNIGFKADESQLKKYIQEQEKSMTDLQEEYFSEVERTVDFSSFNRNTTRLRQLREEQNKILSQMKTKLDKTQQGADYLLTHMNIHETVKGYQSAGRSSFEFYGGFEGAAFGSNLDSQLDIITSSAGSELLGSAGISQADKEWLRFAMINAGKQMIGAPLKPTIENYFSIFVGFFMFNDAAMMIEDAANFINNTYQTASQDLHLYTLNGLIVPTSYLLQKTYESLLPLVNDINATIDTKQSTRAILHTYNGKPSSNDWGEASETAAAATKLEMKFLAGFLDLLNNIQNKMNQP